MSDHALQKAVAAAPHLEKKITHLFGISPLFSELMRGATEDEITRLLLPEEEATLPDAASPWVPDNSFDNLNDAMLALRQCKRLGMRHFLWWELGLHADIELSARHLGIWAGGLLQSAFELATRLIRPRFGEMEKGRFTIIGLGKLGGMELNLGSDVDILFVWDSACRETTGGRRAVSPQEYYQNLSRMIIKLMGEHSIGGIVWPVDMRLRPGGDGSAICLNLDATLDHYCNYGQTWERAMLIKVHLSPLSGLHDSAGSGKNETAHRCPG
jgi:glutamate-ammonia-ligase adenylyltransferase